MKVQAILSVFIVRDADGKMTSRHRRGEVFDLPEKAAKAAIEAGHVRQASSDNGELPPPNHVAGDPRPTQPDGTPLDEDADGNPLVAGILTAAAPDWKAPSTHAEADEMAAKLGISFPRSPKPKVSEKANAIRAMLEAQAAGTVAATSEDLADLSDEELIQRAIDFGHSESEVVELGHDELVLFVAEAMNRRSADPAAQAAATADDEG